MAYDKARRVALVTGGMGGLGEAICIKMAALGYKVVTTHSPGNTKAGEWLDSMKRAGLQLQRVSLRRGGLELGRRVRRRRSPRRRARSTCWSTTPASRAT